MKITQHISAIVIVTMIIALIYAGVQQSYRTGADDPQVQMAHDLGDDLKIGRAIAFDDSIDLEKSMSVFTETYDEQGKPIQSSGFIKGKIPQLPSGVFDVARNLGEHRVTWQPQRKLRMAMCIVHVEAGPVAYLAVGRSLKEVEQRVSRFNTMVVIAWILCICVVLANWLVAYYHSRKKIV
jgi:hypothetical protein